jgi:MoaA/NifB/PqqE/SkfB family radical SAM enzyme
VLDAVDQLVALGVRLVSFTGGEPFLHPDLPKLVEHVQAQGAFSSVVTNGLSLVRRRLTDVLTAGLNSLVLSLDTVDEAVYETIRGVPLAPVLRGLSRVLEERSSYSALRVSVNCVISRANLAHIEALVEYCTTRGVSVGFQPLHSVFAGNGIENGEFTLRIEDTLQLETLVARLLDMKTQGFLINSSRPYIEGLVSFLTRRELPSGFVCNAGFTTIAIDHNLNVRSCWAMKPIGCLLTTPLAELWQSTEYAHRRKRMQALKCPKCWLRCHTEERSEKIIEMLVG